MDMNLRTTELNELTVKQKRALRGELSAEDFATEGMGLFQKGLVLLDPLGVGPRRFPLTEKGKQAATALRAHR